MTDQADQRTLKWFMDRLGLATASKFQDIMAGPRLSGWKNYKAQLVTEILTGNPTETYQSAEMKWGVEYEPLARLYFTLRTGKVVEECGFFRHPLLPAGASPDGLIGTDEDIEIKCPNTATHLETLHTQKIPKKYYAQKQGQYLMDGRSSGYFVSFDPRMPENARIVIIKVERDEEYIKDLEENIAKFMDEVHAEVEFIKSYGKVPV